MQDKDKLIVLQNLINRATEISTHNATVAGRDIDIIELNETTKSMIKIFKARLNDLNN